MPATAARSAFAGMIAITLVLDGKGRVAADPAIIIEGIPEPVHERHPRGAGRAAFVGTIQSARMSTTSRKMSAGRRAGPPKTPGARSPSPGWKSIEI